MYSIINDTNKTQETKITIQTHKKVNRTFQTKTLNIRQNNMGEIQWWLNST